MAQILADALDEGNYSHKMKHHAKEFINSQTKWANETWEQHRRNHPNEYKEVLNGYTSYYSYVLDITKAQIDALFDKPTSVVDFRDYSALAQAYLNLLEKLPNDGDVATIKRFLNKVPKVQI